MMLNFLLTTNFLSIIEEYCKMSGYERKSVRFVFKGRELLQTDTPKSIGMKHEDNIDVYERLN